MVKLSHAVKLEIARLHCLGKSNFLIRKSFEQSGITLSKQLVYYWIKQYEKGALNNDDAQESKTVKMKVVSERDIEIITETLQAKPTTPATDIHKKLVEDGATFCIRTTRNAIKAAGFTRTNPKYCQLIRDVNKVKRVDFCKELIRTNEDFSDVIFSDECTVQLHQNKVVFYRPADEIRRGIPKPKHSLKLHVWAAISRRGPSKILIFDGIMEKVFFTEQILQNTLLPFIQIRFPDGHRFQQDNDPKHRSNLAKQFMENHGINWWESWPPESPDLNPIEMVWSLMKRSIAKEEPKTKEELGDAIQNFWCSLTREQCNRFIDHMFKVVPICVHIDGKATAELPDRMFRESSEGKSIAYFNALLRANNI